MHYLALCTVALLAPLGYTAPLSSSSIPNLINPTAKDVVQNSYIVVYKNGVSDSDATSHEGQVSANISAISKGLRGLGGKFSLPGLRGYQVQADSAGIALLSQSPLVDYVEKDGKVSISRTTTRTPSTWGLARISSKTTISSPYKYLYSSSGCSGTTAYIIDTGILIEHNEFKSSTTTGSKSRAVWGTNFVTGSPNADENGHGTHVAGTIGGLNFGVCPKTTLVAVKVLDKSGSGSWSSIISAIQWAVNDAKAKGNLDQSVINLSISGDVSSAVNAAISSAVNSGMVVAVAAGNSGADASAYSPASEPSALTVGAIDVTNTKPSWSNFGALLDIFAPGVDVISAGFACTTCNSTMSGTSMASPHVAGLALYLMSEEGLSRPTDVAKRIKALGTSGKVQSAGANSTNLIAYNGIGN